MPALDLPSSSHDFGRIPKKPDVAHTFAVQNTGKTELKIWNLLTLCGCTTAELSSSVVPPGQRADLAVTFAPDVHVTQGQVVRLVWFATNDPTQPWAEVRIKAPTCSDRRHPWKAYRPICLFWNRPNGAVQALSEVIY